MNLKVFEGEKGKMINNRFPLTKIEREDVTKYYRNRKEENDI